MEVRWARAEDCCCLLAGCAPGREWSSRTQVPSRTLKIALGCTLYASIRVFVYSRQRKVAFREMRML
eukprot:2158556-Pyramimonas_sp.AAC.1